jgi:hypothetical protein
VAESTAHFLEKYGTGGISLAPGIPLEFVVPAWAAGTKVDMDVTRPILRDSMPGMTKAADELNRELDQSNGIVKI